MSDAALPSCLQCGACCFSRSERYVQVTGDDYSRLAEHAETLTHFLGNRCYMRMHEGHCAALSVRNGEHFCTVYDARPALCRELERGGPACAAELEQKRGLKLRQHPA